MEIVEIKKADGGLDTRIIITDEIQQPAWTVAEHATFYETEAIQLADALCNALPGGTLDRLLARLLMIKASHFIIPSWGDRIRE